jgi:dipeptidase E
LKLLLTSGGITNPSIRSALVQLLGKPISECHALCIPTAQWGHPMCGPRSVRGFVAAQPEWQHPTGLGWASLGLLELTALPTIGAQRWEPWVREADVLLVDGGDATYLCHWMRESGLADLLPSLPEAVWVGVSAGSMVMTPRIGASFVEWPSALDDRTLGVVDFSIFPTWTPSRRTPWLTQSAGPPTSASRPTPSTNRRPSRSSRVSSRWSPKGNGRGSGDRGPPGPSGALVGVRQPVIVACDDAPGSSVLGACPSQRTDRRLGGGSAELVGRRPLAHSGARRAG